MAKIEALLKKHPHLTEEEATKIVVEKNARKKQRRKEAEEREEAKRLKNEAKRPQIEVGEDAVDDVD